LRMRDRPKLRQLREWVVTAPDGTIRHDFTFAVVVSRLAASLPARLKIFVVALWVRMHDVVPGIRGMGTWLTIRYRGDRYRFYVARRSDMYVLHEVLGLGVYDHPKLPEPRTILDLGSHIGSSLLHFSATYPHARIVGVEPNPETFKRLAKNASRLGVEIHRLAVAPADGPIAFYPEGDPLLASTRRPDRGDQAIVVEGRTLESLRRDLGLARVDLLKVDIEAGESMVVASARDVPAIVGEFHDDRDAAARARFLSLFEGFDLQIGGSPHPTFFALKRDT
jgi:FkbM family methyltransferase